MKTTLRRAAAALTLLLGSLQSSAAEPASATAIFAGGCFWCVESDFEAVEGVTAAISGYTGGHLENPSYDKVTRGNTGHFEAVEVHYDPSIVSYRELLSVFWKNIDPLDHRGQFCDKGTSYRSAIFTLDDSQYRSALASLEEARQTLGEGAKIVTPIIPASTFYPAEDYHQDYYKKNPLRYKYYRWNCGRDARLEELWGKP